MAKAAPHMDCIDACTDLHVAVARLEETERWLDSLLKNPRLIASLRDHEAMNLADSRRRIGEERKMVKEIYRDLGNRLRKRKMPWS